MYIYLVPSLACLVPVIRVGKGKYTTKYRQENNDRESEVSFGCVEEVGMLKFTLTEQKNNVILY